MAERVRKRISKWDVPAESQVPVTLGHEDASPKNADDSARVNVLNSEYFSEHESAHFSVPFEMKANTEMMNQEGPEADTKMMNQEGFEISKHSGMAVGNRDDSLKPYEPVSAEHAVAKEDLKPLDQSYGTEIFSSRDGWRKRPSPTGSPKKCRGGLDTSRRSRSLSPSPSQSRGRNRSRSRSRSPSYSYRRGPQSKMHHNYRSPSYGSGRGPERRSDRERTGGGGSEPCRDFAAGRCQRGSECRFPHEESEQRHSATEIRESRFERGRYSSSDLREQSDYSRDKFSRNNRPTAKCYDFTRGRCQRGSSCKFAHHEGSSDETRERGHDWRDEYQSSGRRLGPSRRLPCKFFPEGRCKNGESCRFSHERVERFDDTSCNGPNRGDHVDPNSQWVSIDRSLKVEGYGSNSQVSQSQANETVGCQNQQPEASNRLAVASIAGQSIEQGGESRSVVPQQVQTQMFTTNPQIQPLVTPMPLDAQNQFTVPAPQNFNVSMQNLPVLPPTHIGHSQFQNGQNENLLLEPPSSSQSTNEQLVNRNGLFNGQQMQRNELMKEQSLKLISDNPITPKLVNNEQAAQITNNSATLAHLFGSGGALNPQIVNNLTPGLEQNGITVKGTQANVNNSSSSITIGGFNDDNPPSKSAGTEEKVQQVMEGNSASKEEQKKETGQNKKEQGKDAKAMRMFKAALVDYVKEVLKPSWKEGHLSKEAHKTIVKKVVEKVTGVTQGSSIPQTPEKIDLYLSHSRVKLNKLVQVLDPDNLVTTHERSTAFWIQHPLEDLVEESKIPESKPMRIW